MKKLLIALGLALSIASPASYAQGAPMAGAGGATMAVPVAIGIAAGAAIVTGVVVHQATKCDNCASPTPAT